MTELIGGGIFGLLAVVAIQLMLRTREVDERRDALTRSVAEHERHVSADRDALLDELRDMRRELSEVHARLIYDQRGHTDQRGNIDDFS